MTPNCERLRQDIVPRPRLVERLSAGLRKPLTLISAPAGYGKSTLFIDWRATAGSEYSLWQEAVNQE